jgi:hypothetical protein
LDVVFVI